MPTPSGEDPALGAMPKHFRACGLDAAYQLGVCQARTESQANPWQYFTDKELAEIFGFQQVQLSALERQTIKDRMAKLALNTITQRQTTPDTATR